MYGVTYSQIHLIQCSNYFHLSSSNRDGVGQGKVGIFDVGVLPELCYESARLVTWCGISLIKYDEILEIEMHVP